MSAVGRDPNFRCRWSHLPVPAIHGRGQSQLGCKVAPTAATNGALHSYVASTASSRPEVLSHLLGQHLAQELRVLLLAAGCCWSRDSVAFAASILVAVAATATQRRPVKKAGICIVDGRVPLLDPGECLQKALIQLLAGIRLLHRPEHSSETHAAPWVCS